MFKNMISPKIISVLTAVIFAAGIVFAQDAPPPNQPFDEPRNRNRRDVLAELGLSQEQKQQFRRNNQAHRPLMNAAQQRMREANRELDVAIYADVVSEETIRAKLRAFQEAQAEVNKLRFMNELAIRKILTAEQLMRFREMRRLFAERMQQRMRGDQPRDASSPVPGSQFHRPGDRKPAARPAVRQNRPRT